MRSIKGDMWLALCVVVLAAIYLYADIQLPEVRMSDPLGPKAFPALVGVGLLFSALLLALEAWRKQRTETRQQTQQEPAVQQHALQKTADPQAEAGHGEVKEKSKPLVLIGVVAWTLLYYLCFEPVGYILATIVFLIGMLSYFNRKRLKTNIAVAFGMTMFFYLLFTQLLGVPMPTGPLPF